MTSTALERKPTPISPPSLLNSFRSEWYKLSSLRTPWIVSAVVALLTAVAGALVTRTVQNFLEGEGELEGVEAIGAITAMPFANYLGVIAVVVVGALIGSGDFQHKTSVATLMQQPKRLQFLLAKVGFGVASSVALALGLIATCVTAAAIFAPRIGKFSPITSEATDFDEAQLLGLADILPIAVGHLVLAGLFGLGLGLATRSTTFAVSGFFIMRFVEIVVAGASGHWITNLLPFRAGDRLLPYVENAGDPGRFGSPLASAITYVSAIALLLAIGVVRTYREDIG